MGKRWAWIVVGLLGVQMAGVVVMMRIAKDDAGFAVEPDYYEKAVRWDETARARASAERLGWGAAATLGPVIGAEGERELRVRLDGAGAGLTGATVRAEVFPHARSGQRSRVELVELEGGEYAARVAAVRGGLWEVRLEITKGGGAAQLSCTVEALE
jgi:nitrogen fixation protein FixH